MRLALLNILLIPVTMSFAQQLHKHEKINFLALGDSYTIGESVAEKERWPVILIEELRKLGFDCDDPKIIATTGWRTDQLKKAIEDAELSRDYNLVSLLIGVNNQYQNKSLDNYKHEFEVLLQVAIGLAGKKENVFVVSIPDYGFTPFGIAKQKIISGQIDNFNFVNRSITEKYGVTYFNITPISRLGLSQPELIASDGLHPSGQMYRQWVELILKNIIHK